jgi:hypothetical protein
MTEQQQPQPEPQPQPHLDSEFKRELRDPRHRYILREHAEQALIRFIAVVQGEDDCFLDMVHDELFKDWVDTLPDNFERYYKDRVAEVGAAYDEDHPEEADALARLAEDALARPADKEENP